MCAYEEDKLSPECYSHKPTIWVTRMHPALDLDQDTTLIHPEPEPGQDFKPEAQQEVNYAHLGGLQEIIYVHLWFEPFEKFTICPFRLIGFLIYG